MFLPPRRRQARPRTPPPPPLTIEDIAARTGRSYEDVYELREERAAIREYLGGLPRAEAERLALADALEFFQGLT